MSTAAIRKKLHHYLEVADDKKVEAIYAIMEADVEKAVVEYSPELQQELDSRLTSYRTGKAEICTEQESKERIRKILGGPNPALLK